MIQPTPANERRRAADSGLARRATPTGRRSGATRRRISRSAGHQRPGPVSPRPSRRRVRAASSTVTTTSACSSPSRPRAAAMSSDSDGALLTALTHNMTAERAGPGALSAHQLGLRRIPRRATSHPVRRRHQRRRADRGDRRRRRVRPGRLGARLRHVDEDSRSLASSPTARSSRSTSATTDVTSSTRDLGDDVQLLDVEAGTTPSAGAGQRDVGERLLPSRPRPVRPGDWRRCAAAVGRRRRSPRSTSRLPPSPLGLAVLRARRHAGRRGADRRRLLGHRARPRGAPGRARGPRGRARPRSPCRPTGTWLAGADPQGRVHVWDLRKGLLRGDAASRPDSVRGIAFSPTSPSILAIGSSGGGVSLYDVESEQVIGEPLYGHGTGTRDVAFSADGRYLVTIADDGLVGLWGANDGSGPSTDRDRPRRRRIPSYSSDGRRVAVRVAGRIEVRGRPSDRRAPGVRVRHPPGSMAGHELPAQRRRVERAGVRAGVQRWRSSPTRRPAAPIWVSSARRLHAAVRELERRRTARRHGGLLVPDASGRRTCGPAQPWPR